MINKLMLIYRAYAVKQYFYLRRTSNNRNVRRVKFLLFTPFLLLVSGWNFLYERTVKRIVLAQKVKEDLAKEYEYELVFAAIAKNEGLYIREWIEYHRLVGVDRFVIYDNESTDNMKEVLQPYIDDGLVDYTYFPGRAKQLDAYYDALVRYKKRARLMGFIDLDEFVVPVEENKSVVQVVLEIFKENKNAVGVIINWLVFGSSGYQKRPEGLVMESYLKRAEYDYINNRCVKTIVNPRMTKGYILDPHAPMNYCGFHNVTETGHIVVGPWNPYPNSSYERIRVNHYYCKSLEEGKIKFDRGLATHENDEKNPWEKYYEFDKNDVYDDMILRYLKCLKQTLEEKIYDNEAEDLL